MRCPISKNKLAGAVHSSPGSLPGVFLCLGRGVAAFRVGARASSRSGPRARPGSFPAVNLYRFSSVSGFLLAFAGFGRSSGSRSRARGRSFVWLGLTWVGCLSLGSAWGRFGVWFGLIGGGGRGGGLCENFHNLGGGGAAARRRGGSPRRSRKPHRAKKPHRA